MNKNVSQETSIPVTQLCLIISIARNMNKNINKD